eukprot:NODE_10_length_61504_cov_0.956502.p48 type:complete len:137 gc:universal NODE_10_length_61504_cov_0.956502:37067-37477(+)
MNRSNSQRDDNVTPKKRKIYHEIRNDFSESHIDNYLRQKFQEMHSSYFDQMINMAQQISKLQEKVANLESVVASNSNAKRENNNVQCIICVDDCTGPVMTSCGHIFCENCLTKWLEVQNVCPTCRNNNLVFNKLFV